MIEFHSKSANSSWIIAAKTIQKGDNVKSQGSRIGKTDELLHVMFTIEDPRQRWVVARRPPINPAFAIAETVWIINGRNDSRFLNYWNKRLSEFAGSGNAYHGAYGHRIRKGFGIDQLERAYFTLRNNPDSRQVVLTIWNPTLDFPNTQGNPKNEDIPCNIVSLLKLRKGKLYWTQIMRSNDIFRGLPYNFVQFTTLQEVLGGWLDVELGVYNHFSDSLHRYQNDGNKIIDKNIKQETNTDSLALNKKESLERFRELAEKIDSLIDPKLSETQFHKLRVWKKANPAHMNLLLLLLAEVARRKSWFNIADELMTGCTNPQLNQMWSRWYNERRKR
jgi:thymidylate synthase